MPSIVHRLGKLALKLEGYPAKFESMIGGKGLVRHFPNRSAIKRHGVRQKSFGGFPFLWFDPAKGERRPGVVIAFHGGGFVMEAQPAHLAAYGKLADACGMRVYVPYYPLAPEHSPYAILEWSRRFVSHVAEHVGDVPLFLTGDSAGANLALRLVEAGVQPERMVLWSPWVDVEMANPDLATNDGKCALLGLDNMDVIRGAYTGDVDPRSLSPAFSEDLELPPTLILSGSHCLLHPDIVRYADAQTAKGQPVTLETADALFHDYMLLPSREGKAAIRRTAEYLSGV